MPVYQHSSLPELAARPLPKAKRSHLVRRDTDAEETLPSPSTTFDSLPTELQIEIFSHLQSTLPRFDNVEGPYLLGRVSKAWRYLVWHTPRLWSSFQIEVPKSTAELASSYDVNTIRTMERWLSRSKNHPLSFHIAHTPLRNTPDQRSASLLIALLPHARRWKNVELLLPESDVVVLQQLLHITLPQLQALTLRLDGTWSSGSYLDITALNIPWCQLTILELQLVHSNLDLDQCQDILSKAENLERFTATVQCYMEDSDTPTKYVNLSKLETLDISLQGSGMPLPAAGRPESHFTRFISSLSLPRLRNLSLGWLVRQTTAHWSENHSTFTTFLRNVARTTESLSIRYLPLSADELMECLASLPNVRHMDVRFPLGDIEKDPITDHFFKKLTVPGAPSDKTKQRNHVQPLLPHLLTINLQCYGSSYTNPALVSFLDSRMKLQSGDQVHRLASFHIQSMLPILPSMEKRVEQYRLEGHDVSMDALLCR